MYRNEKERIFGEPMSLVENHKKNQSEFIININNYDKKLLNNKTQKSNETILVNIVKEDSIKKFVESNDYEGFLEYVGSKLKLNREYSVVEKPHGDAKTITNIWYVLEAAAVAIVGALLVIDVTAKSIFSKEEKVIVDIISAANLAGGKEFCMGVAKVIKKEIMKRGTSINAVEAY
ncbi:hypothetical protein [Clostridium felsineum]|uniref:hypothetical protein n=1 Tax=Clostridium felsineum TaxID=36839 RepID=UPI00098CB523|nr:hypothetical protein [Clostridium felsineum]URZ18669.1 hypothetical protein CLFE_047570 [Clostridium felsineum DSM 794]